MGLKAGEHPEKIHVIRIVHVRREALDEMRTNPEYGKVECILEGFPEMDGGQFVKMFCDHNGCNPWDEITRIEFEYVD